MKLPSVLSLKETLEAKTRSSLQWMWEELVRAINFNDQFVAEVNLTTQSAVAAVELNNVLAPGFHRLSYYLTCTTQDGAAGTLRVDFSFTDNEGAVVVQSTAISLTAASRTSGVVVIQLASGGITYTPVVASGVLGNARYDLRIYLERLGD